MWRLLQVRRVLDLLVWVSQSHRESSVHTASSSSVFQSEKSGLPTQVVEFSQGLIHTWGEKGRGELTDKFLQALWYACDTVD